MSPENQIPKTTKIKAKNYWEENRDSGVYLQPQSKGSGEDLPD